MDVHLEVVLILEVNIKTPTFCFIRIYCICNNFEIGNGYRTFHPDD